MELREVQLRCRPEPNCYLCGCHGAPLYKGLTDRLFGAPGVWNLVRCADPACGLIWLDPMPLADDLGVAYVSYYTHGEPLKREESWVLAAYRAAKQGYLATRYGYAGAALNVNQRLAAGLIYVMPTLRVLVDFSVMWLPCLPGGRLLDVGCGSGVFLRRMRDLSWDVEGVEFDAEAARRVSANGIPVHVGDLTTLMLQPNHYDAVTMSHLIEHVPNPIALIRECHRILKPGGRMVVVTPNSESLGHRVYGSAWMHLDPPRHLHLFNAQTLARVADAGGVWKKTIWTTPRDAAGVFAGSRSIRRTGCHDMSATLPFWTALWAKGCEVGEWLFTCVVAERGEDLVLTAWKQA